MENIEKILQRGEKIELLVGKTDDLATHVSDAGGGFAPYGMHGWRIRVPRLCAVWSLQMHLLCPDARHLLHFLPAAHMVAQHSAHHTRAHTRPFTAAEGGCIGCAHPPWLAGCAQAETFQKKGRALRSKMWWQNLRMKLCVLGVLIVLGIVIFVLVCFSGGNCIKGK